MKTKTPFSSNRKRAKDANEYLFVTQLVVTIKQILKRKVRHKEVLIVELLVPMAFLLIIIGCSKIGSATGYHKFDKSDALYGDIDIGRYSETANDKGEMKLSLFKSSNGNNDLDLNVIRALLIDVASSNFKLLIDILDQRHRFKVQGFTYPSTVTSSEMVVLFEAFDPLQLGYTVRTKQGDVPKTSVFFNRMDSCQQSFEANAFNFTVENCPSLSYHRLSLVQSWINRVWLQVSSYLLNMSVL